MTKRAKFGGRYVFVSHASADKPRVAVVVRELIRLGVPIWIDRPYEMGIAREDVAGCIDREASGNAETAKAQIDKGLRSAFGMLIFPSQHTKKSEQVNLEIGFALAEKLGYPDEFGLTPLFLDQQAFAFPEWRTGDTQGFSTFVEQAEDATWRLTDGGQRETARAAEIFCAHLARMERLSRKRTLKRQGLGAKLAKLSRNTRFLAMVWTACVAICLAAYGADYGHVLQASQAADPLILWTVLAAVLAIAPPLVLVQIFSIDHPLSALTWLIAMGCLINTLVLVLAFMNLVRAAIGRFRTAE